MTFMQSLKIIFFLFFIYSIEAQTIAGKLINEESKTPVSFAHITILNEIGVVSNEDGNFSLHLNGKYQNEIVEISALGFEILKIPVKDFKPEMEILMKTTDLILDEVVVGNSVNPIAIIEKYKENYATNHVYDQLAITYFTRSKETFFPKILEIESEKINFQNKKEFQKQMDDFTKTFVGKKTFGFTESLFEVYYDGKKRNINPIKALKMNAENGLDIDNFENKFFKSTFQSLKSLYTYKIKSGWIPLEKDVSLNELEKEEAAQDTLSSKTISYRIYGGSIKQKDFINKTNLYDYEFEGMTNIQGFSCYHLSFKTEKSRAKYKGNLYINSDDYAMIQYDYALEDDKKEFGINLKWIFGVKFNTFESSARGQFARSNKGFYYPILSRTSSSDYAYIHRGLSMKENHPNRSERKILKLDFKIEMIVSSVDEVVVLETKEINSELFDPLNFPKFVLYETKTKYDPDYWLPYNVLEATKEIKQFEVKN